MSQLLIEKYHPKSSKQIIGNQYALKCLTKNIQSNTPTVITGPPGTGKTIATQLLLKENSYINTVSIDCFAHNAKLQLENCLRAFKSNPTSITGKSALILDNIEGCDQNIITALKQFIAQYKKTPLFPIIVICNDSSSKQCRLIRSVCDTIWFNSVRSYEITQLLCKIYRKEHSHPPTVATINYINAVGDSCRGDVRAAIIKLENSNYRSDKIWTNPFKTIEYILKSPHTATFDSLTYAAESDLFLMTGMVHEHVNDVVKNNNILDQVCDVFT